MKIVFVYRAVESFGLEYLSALLKSNGHAVVLVFDPDLFGLDHYLHSRWLQRCFARRRQVVERIIAAQPDLIGFSVPTVYYPWARELAAAVKARISVPVIFGGIHPTAAPDEVLSHAAIDYVAVGEADGALLELANNLAAGGDGRGIANIWSRVEGRVVRQPLRPLVADLDALPLPDKSLFAPVIPMTYLYKTAAGRGCPYSCSFCCHSLLKRLYPGGKGYLRLRSPRRVLEELRLAKQRYGFRVLHFDDDTFTADRDWLRELLAGYRADIGVPFSCVSHPQCLDRERAQWLREAGCFLAELGVQTLNENIRREVLNRQESNVDIERACAACEAARLPFQVDHIFGLPGETDADARSAIEFYARWRWLARVECFRLAYHPGTTLLEKIEPLPAERMAAIAAGCEPMYFAGGSVRDPQASRRAAAYTLAAKMLTVWRGGARLLLACGVRHWGWLVPGTALTLLEALNALLRRDRRPLYYLAYYRRHLFGDGSR